MNVEAGLRLRNAHQPLDVRADVIDREAVGVEHDEDVVDVAGKGGEQVLTVEQLGVALPEARAVAQPQEVDQHDAQHRRQRGDHGERARLQTVHAGVDHAGGHRAQHDPVLKAGGLVDEIVAFAVQGEGGHAGVAAEEGRLQLRDLSIRHVRAVAQRAQEVVDVPQRAAGVVHQHAPVREDDVAAGEAVERGNLQRADQIAVVEADGDGFIVKALEGALRGGHHEDHDLRLARNDRGDHRVAPLQNDAGE